MNRFALIIGIEHYAEKIPQVRFAENDAQKFEECLIELGYDPRDVTCLPSSKATKTKIESELRRLASMAQENDEILLFFAGHGVSISGSNYITCYDTVRTDLVNSCIPLKWILDLLKSSRSKRILLFLDSCHSGFEIDSSMRGILDTLSEGELEEFFADAEYQVGFASCRTDQFSYSSPNLRHGIWTHHLLQALRGEAPGAVEKNKYITSASLQNYLADQVPKTLRVENPNPVVQTPRCFGSFSKEFQVFDIESIVAQRSAERKARLLGVKHIDMIGTKGGSIRELSGFRKGHFVPDKVDGHTESFVDDIASKDATEEATEIFEKIKSNFGYRRKEIQLETSGASAEIATKDFDLSIRYFQDPEEPGDYTIEYLIANVRDADALQDKGLQKILNRHFDEVRFSISGSVDIEELIDRLEEEEPEGISIEYPSDCSALTVHPNESDWKIHIERKTISIINHYLESPVNMLLCLKESQNLISSEANLRHLLK